MTDAEGPATGDGGGELPSGAAPGPQGQLSCVHLFAMLLLVGVFMAFLPGTWLVAYRNWGFLGGVGGVLLLVVVSVLVAGVGLILTVWLVFALAWLFSPEVRRQIRNDIRKDRGEDPAG